MEEGMKREGASAKLPQRGGWREGAGSGITFYSGVIRKTKMLFLSLVFPGVDKGQPGDRFVCEGLLLLEIVARSLLFFWFSVFG